MQSKRILAAAANVEALGCVEEFLLERGEADLERVADATSALSLAARRRFDLIVSEFPLPRLHLASFLDSLRRPASTCRDSPVLLLAGTGARDEIERLGPRRRRGVEVCCSRAQTLRALARGLGLDDRLRAELPVRVTAATATASGTRIWTTRDISPSGMLLASDELLPVGLVLPIAIELPEGEQMVHGRAEVVRHTDPRREGIQGTGMEFLELFGDGPERLESFVRAGRERRRVERLAG